jgi:hypothetical protein
VTSVPPDKADRRPRAGTAIQEAVDETETSVTPPADKPRRYTSRWAAHHLDRLAVVDVVQALPDPGCSGWHPGQCDRWGSCSAMNLGVVERAALGRSHPGRVAA